MICPETEFRRLENHAAERQQDQDREINQRVAQRQTAGQHAVSFLQPLIICFDKSGRRCRHPLKCTRKALVALAKDVIDGKGLHGREKRGVLLQQLSGSRGRR